MFGFFSDQDFPSAMFSTKEFSSELSSDFTLTIILTGKAAFPTGVFQV